MASLDAALTEMDKILNEVQSSARLNSLSERAKLVVEVRTRILAQIAQLSECLRTDARLQADPAAAKAFAEKLADLRRTLAALQAKWRAAEIVEKFESYAVESTPVAKACMDFVQWARTYRKAA